MPVLNDFTGLLTRSRSGRVVSFMCFGIPAQAGTGPHQLSPARWPRIVARVFQDGTVDTSQGVSGALQIVREWRGISERSAFLPSRGSRLHRLARLLTYTAIAPFPFCVRPIQTRTETWAAPSFPPSWTTS
jgi:hypothetical protein